MGRLYSFALNRNLVYNMIVFLKILNFFNLENYLLTQDL